MRVRTQRGSTRRERSTSRLLGRAALLFAMLSCAGCLLLSSHDDPWPCDANDDCASGEVCRSEADAFGRGGEKRCLAPLPCDDRTNACSGGAVCIEGTCRIVECTPSNDRCGAYRCDGSTFTCRTSCGDNDACSSSKQCKNGACVDRECEINGGDACGGFECAGGSCRTSCLPSTNDGCRQGYRCAGGSACVPKTDIVGGGEGGSGGSSGSGGSGGAASSAGTSGSAGAGGTCDPVAQSGCAGAKPKCSITTTSGSKSGAACVESGGSKNPKDPCTRASLGHDDCKPGYVCTGAGVYYYTPNSQKYECQRLCRKDDDCPGSFAFCAALSDDGYGVCLDACKPFEPCGFMSSSCSQLYADTDGTTFYAVCGIIGTKPQGATCVSATDCQANMVCGVENETSTSDLCQALCDGDHPCPKGTLCSVDGKVACAPSEVCYCM